MAKVVNFVASVISEVINRTSGDMSKVLKTLADTQERLLESERLCRHWKAEAQRAWLEYRRFMDGNNE